MLTWTLEEDEADDLLLAIEQELRKRRIGWDSCTARNSIPDS